MDEKILQALEGKVAETCRVLNWLENDMGMISLYQKILATQIELIEAMGLKVSLDIISGKYSQVAVLEA